MMEQNTLSKEDFGLRLAKLRQGKGISARQMSLDIGQNKNYINSIETGHNYPTMSNFFEICNYLEITPQNFFRSEEEQQQETPTIELNEFYQITNHLSAQKVYHLSLLVNDLLETEDYREY